MSNWNRQSVLEHIASNATLTAVLDHVRNNADGDAAHDVDHVLRVAVWTLRIGGAHLDPNAAIAAALLHDIVNPPKNSPLRSRASQLAADHARQLLTELSFPSAHIESVCDAIRDHSYSRGATPERLLGRALQDADRLETLGAIGLFRVAATGARMGARFFDPDDPWAERRKLDDLKYTVDHFFTKLLKLPETLTTEAGRTEARRRAQLLQAFLDQLATELD